MNTKTRDNQWLNRKVELAGDIDDDLITWLEAFMLDRKAQNMTSGTIYYYQSKLKIFAQYCDGQAITRITQITPDIIRRYMLWAAETHNPGGQHQLFRTLKTFLLWWERETEPEGWKNPIRKVKAPKVGIEPLDPVDLDDLKLILDTCKTDLVGSRDQALLFVLLDTGARASEVCAMDREDYNLITGEITIRQGKGRKSRAVFLGEKSRKATRRYLKIRKDDNPALWITKKSERLTYWGLDEMVSRRAKMAGVEKPELHAFRRAFALNMLRAGVDVYSLQRLMGHADLQVLQRYLAETTEDLKAAHVKGGPVDRLLK